jgi:hypothetical protein
MLKIARSIVVFAFIICLSSTAAHAAFTTMATPVNAGVGVAADPSGNAVYFTEWSTGSLKRIALTPPGCSAPACPVTTVASGFSHPQDVALDMVHNTAYVTTRDDPGTTGALWRVDLTTGVRTLITFNLGAPHQIALDVAANAAYVVGFTSGRLWKINLTTGSKTTIFSGLGSPVGLTLKADRTRAYVTEQAPARVAEIDVATHTRIRNVVTGLVSPFYLSWTDPAELALYVVERAPNNDVLRVDLSTSSGVPTFTGLPSNPSGISVNGLGAAAYITTNGSVIRVDLSGLAMGEPVFIGVGNTPSTSINALGYANTVHTLPPYFDSTDAPFGGTLNIFGNLNNFRALGATHYRVNVNDGSTTTALTNTWNTTHYNPVTGFYEPFAVAPVNVPAVPTPFDHLYEISSDYPLLATRWWPPFLMLRWPSGANGTFTFSVEIFKVSGTTVTNLTPLLPVAKNKLVLRIDNDPPEADILHIYQHGSLAPLSVCQIIQPPAFPAFPGALPLDFEIKASDPNGHLLSYGVTAYFGHTSPPATVLSDTFVPGHVVGLPPHLWFGTSSLRGPAAGWIPPCNCAYTFIIDVWKRTIDGNGYFIHSGAHQSITIMNAGPVGTTCP